MLKTILLTLCVLCALLLVGCSNSETTNNNNMSMANANKPAMASSTPATMTSTPATAKTSDSGGKIGVPECDEFLAAYDACVSKNVPDTARAQYKAALAGWRNAWRNAASTPQGKAGLAKTCKSVIEQTRATMKPYNCAF